MIKKLLRRTPLTDKDKIDELDDPEDEKEAGVPW